ncbi:MAG: ATP-binding cassette domain-containing protein [Candidatus Nanopelagicales bacterium]
MSRRDLRLPILRLVTAGRSAEPAFRPGVLWLLGPNGAGKTTLMRALSTAVPPRRGSISVLGRESRTRLAPEPRADISATCRSSSTCQHDSLCWSCPLRGVATGSSRVSRIAGVR